MVIAIDGPAGSGKSTMAKLLSKKMGYIYLDTGAMYRICTLKLINEGVNIDEINELDNDTLKKYIDNIKMEIKNDRFYLDGIDVGEKIREPEIAENVSKVAGIDYIRIKMVELQRDFAKGHDIIVDGRDIGTVVFPEANVKFFVVADAKKRAERRYKELVEKGIDTSFEKIYNNILLRDEMDTKRAVSPLKKAYDAIDIDTTEKSIEEVCALMIEYINKKIHMDNYFVNNDKDNVNVFLISNSNKLPANKLSILKKEMKRLSEEEILLLGMQLKNPVVALVLSLVFGVLGVDRMYIGQIGLGILKFILTLFGIGIIWVIIDYFIIMKKTKELNYKKIIKKIGYY